MLPRLLLVAAILFVQICCIPPLEAAVMVCPITGEQCEASADCDPAPPVAASATEVPTVVAPQAGAIVIHEKPAPPHAPDATITFRTPPTRTTVLRI
jgi:hypothetical protein